MHTNWDVLYKSEHDIYITALRVKARAPGSNMAVECNF